jgi:DDE superfamily endonuclease
MSVTYTAVLDVSEDSVLFLSGLLHAERERRGTRTDSRALSTDKQAVLVQAVLVLRWLFDDTRMTQLARDNTIGLSTAYDYRDEAITVLAADKPSLHGALLAAKAAGHTHVILDGTLICTDRISTPGPTRGVDLWWSGKHRHHGGNIQVVSAPDGWPLWTSPVRPGREHDTTAARADPELAHPDRRLGRRRPARAGRPGLRRRSRDPSDPDQEDRGRRPDLRPAGLQRRPRRPALPGRARQQPAQDHLQGTATLARLPLAHRRHRRRRVGPAPPRTPPHHLSHQISPSVITALPGMAQWAVACGKCCAARESNPQPAD